MALFCLSPDNAIRRACVALSDTSRTEGKWFNNLVLGCILLTTVALSAENAQIGRHSTMHTFLLVSDYIVNTAFTLEFLIKLVALGWNAYIASPWNKISLLIVVTSDLEMILSKLPAVSSSAGILRIFRIFRVLRPLRMAAESFPGLLVLVNTAQMSAGPLGNTLCMTMIILCVLSIIGLQIFAHKMSACSDPGVWTKLQCTGLDDDQIPREWQAYPVNFDNLVQGRCPRAGFAGRRTHVWMYACLDMHTHTHTHTHTGVLAQIMLATQDDWPPHMFAASDVTGPVTGPYENIEISLAAIFYISSVLIAGAVLVNTVVGIFVENYEVAVSARRECRALSLTC